MHPHATSVQQRPSVDDTVDRRDLHRLLVGLRVLVDGPLNALTSYGSAATGEVLMDLCSLRASLDNHIDVVSTWRPREVIESLLTDVASREAAQFVSSSSSARDAEPAEVSAEPFTGWLPLSPSSAIEQPQAVGTLPVPDRSPREHHIVPANVNADDVFGLDGVRLERSL